MKFFDGVLVSRAIAACLYLVNSLVLYLGIIGLAKYFLGDGGWINYVIVASLLFIFSASRLLIARGIGANK